MAQAGELDPVEHEEVLGRAAAADDQVVPEIPGRGHARDGLEGPADVLESPGELADLHPGQAEEARGRGLGSLRLLGRDRDLAAQDLEAGADRDLAGRPESPDAGDDGEIAVLLDQALVIAGGNAGQDIGSVLAGDRGPGRIEQGDAGPGERGACFPVRDAAAEGEFGAGRPGGPDGTGPEEGQDQEDAGFGQD